MLDRIAGIAVVAEGVRPLELPARRYADAVVDVAASLYGVAPGSIFMRGRERRLAEARQVVMYALRVNGLFTLEEAAAYLSRDHSTIHHGVAQIKKRRAVDPGMDAILRRLAAVPTFAEDSDITEDFDYAASLKLCEAADGMLLAAETALHALRRAVHASRVAIKRERVTVLARREG